MSNISVIQIFVKNNDPEKIIENNAKFLSNLNIEYIVYDNLSGFEIVKFIKNIKGVKYFRKNFKNIYQSILETLELSAGKRLIFLEEIDYLNDRNVFKIEENRINILSDDLRRIKNIRLENLDLEHIYLFLKSNKNLLEKIKLAFKFLS